MPTHVLSYHNVQLYDSDVALFTSRQWLNDKALHFYLEYLTQTTASRDVLLMDPAVVSCLVHQCEDKDEYQDLAQGLDVATRRLCLVPVADNDTLDGASCHWSLLLYRDGTFHHLDSSAGHNKHAARRVAKAFEQLLEAIGRHDGKGASDRVEDVAQAPQQQNGYDCGLYVLMGAEYFCRPLTMNAMTVAAYATPERATRLRVHILQLIEELRMPTTVDAKDGASAQCEGEEKLV